MQKKIKKYLFEMTVFVVLVLVISGGVSYFRSMQMNMDDSVCQNGVRIVYFWGSWCPVCKMESPNIDRVSHLFPVKSVAVKSGDMRQVASYMQNAGYKFEYLADEDGVIAHKYGVDVFPTLVFCKDGHPFWIESGYVTTLGVIVRGWLAGL